MREKLIKLLENMDGIDHMDAREAGVDWWDVADYLLDNGVIVLPCKVGDTVWIVRENIYEATVHRVVLSISESDNFINLDVEYEYVDWFYDDGRKATATALCRYLRDAFLTKEEAERALAELKGE